MTTTDRALLVVGAVCCLTAGYTVAAVYLPGWANTSLAIGLITVSVLVTVGVLALAHYGGGGGAHRGRKR